MELSPEELEKLATLFNAFSQRTRLAILLGFYHGDAPPVIADQLGISRPGLQNHLVKMRDADLLRKTENGSYELTPVGTYFAKLVEDQQSKLQNAIDIIDSAESEAEKMLSEQVNPEMISEEEWTRIIETKKWELAMDSVSDALGTTD